MARAESCSRCGLENPPTFPACARCYAPIGFASVTRASGSGRISSDEFATYGSSELPLDAALAAAERGVLGRDAEITKVREAAERAFRERRPQFVVIEGARGSGTTRLLIHTAHVALGVANDARLMHAVCIEGREGELSPLNRLLLQRFHITPSSAELSARARITTEVGEALGATDAAAVSQVAHLLGRAAGLEFPDSPILRALEKSPDELRERTRSAIARFLCADAARGPIWIGIDNATRMDPSAWAVLAEIATCETPILFVCAGEPGLAAVAAAEARIEVETLRIGALPESVVADLVRRLVPDLEELPEPLVAAITHRSGGMPSEVRQLVFSLLEGELFVAGADGKLRVDLPRMERGELPISMDDALQARLARLDKHEREALDMASICGESFWDGALLCQVRLEATAAPPGIDQDDPEDDALTLASTLGLLVTKGFVQAVSGGGVVPANEYRFSTPRMRAIVYAGMPEPTRRARHLAVARWLDVAGARRRDAVSATVGFHLELAGELAGAGQAYARAAALERGHRRFDRALAWLERAEHCTPRNDPMALIDLAHDRGAALVACGRTDEAITAFERMHELSRRLGARAKQAAAIDRIARAHSGRGQPKRALPLLLRALALVQRSGDRRGIASCLDDIAQVELVLGHADRAQMAGIEALELRRALGDARGESLSLTTLGRIALRRGELAMAEERLRTALAIRESIDDVEGVIVTLTALGRVAFERGDREAAVEPWQRALSLCRDLGDRRSEQTLLAHVGEANLGLGRLPAAESNLVAAKELAVSHEDKRSVARCDVLLGRVAMRRGDERAGRLLRLSLEAAQAADAPDVLGLAHRALGQYDSLRAEKDPAFARTARDHFEASLGAFALAGSEKERARTLLDMAHLGAVVGDKDEARGWLAEASAILAATQLPEARIAERMRASLG